MKKQVIFKEVNQHQLSLFPERLDTYIPENHIVRLVNKVVDGLNISSILQSYKGGGTSSYHPRMLLKVLIYGYLNNIYSSRKIAKALSENIHFMWLSGKQFPDFRTINDFRGKRLKNEIKRIFVEVVLMLSELGLVSLKLAYTDGTKMESVSNRYRFVWRKNVERYKGNLEKKIKQILEEIDAQIIQDNKTENNETFPNEKLSSNK